MIAFKSRIFQTQIFWKFCMKTSRFTESQITAILKQAEGGSPVPELCREHGISNATFYKWRSRFGGMDASLMARMKELEDENRRLKKMYAEERLKAEVVAEALSKKW
jgi:putative transposase